MNIAVDVDGTILANPDFYRALMKEWKPLGKRYILTARPITQRFITTSDLALCDIFPGEHYDEIILYPEKYLWLEKERCFIEDTTGVKEFAGRLHLEECLSLSSTMCRLNTVEFGSKLANWKAETCVNYGIDLLFDDGFGNVERSREKGVKACLVVNERKR